MARPGSTKPGVATRIPTQRVRLPIDPNVPPVTSFAARRSRQRQPWSRRSTLPSPIAAVESNTPATKQGLESRNRPQSWRTSTATTSKLTQRSRLPLRNKGFGPETALVVEDEHRDDPRSDSSEAGSRIQLRNKCLNPENRPNLWRKAPRRPRCEFNEAGSSYEASAR